MSVLRRAQDLLDRVAYKPGVSLGVQPVGSAEFPDERWNIADPSVVGVYLTASVDDVYQPGRPILYGQVQMVPRFLLDEGQDRAFYDWLFKTLVMEAERHEAAEQFTVDGRRVFDPHVGGEGR